MFRKSAGWIGGLVAVAFAMTACSDSTAPGSSSLSLQLTDAEGDVAEAWVEITEIALQGEVPGSQGSLELPYTSEGLIDLVPLQGEDAHFDLIDDAQIPSGTYAQLRLEIGEAIIVTDDGQIFSKEGTLPPSAEEGAEIDGTLTCPSCELTGIKVNLPGGALRLENEAKVLMLDFDVAQSFGREAGDAGMWVMNPLIRTSEVELSGTIAGTVSTDVEIPACGGEDRSVADFVPLAVNGGEEPASGNVESDGSYTIDFLEQGEYSLEYEAEITFGTETGTETLTFGVVENDARTVNVESGATVTEDFTIDEATCTTDDS